MSQVSVDTGFAKASDLLAEIDKFFHVCVWEDVGALLWSLWTEDIAEHCDMADLLLGHEGDQFTVCGC